MNRRADRRALGVLHLALGWTLCTLGLVSSTAQETRPAPPPTPAPAATTSAAGVPGPQPGSPTAGAQPAPAQPAPEERRLQELLKLQFDRRPASILQALAKLPDRLEITNEVQRFQNDVIAGYWFGVGEFIAQLPQAHRPQVYARLLQDLQRPPHQLVPQPGGMPFAPAPPLPGAPPPPTTSLLPEDIIALANLAPATLTQEQAETLGRMLGQVLTRGVYFEPLLQQLEAGTAQLGGADPAKRALAATLLLAANRTEDALRFMPALEAARQTQDARALNLHARVLTATAPAKEASTAVRQAWEITQTVLALTNAPATERDQALQRALELLPQLRRQLGDPWLHATFTANPGHARNLVAAAGALVVQGQSTPDVNARQRNLKLQQQLVSALLEVAGTNAAPWRPSLNLLALAWVFEADMSAQRQVVMGNQMVEYDPYGNPIYYGPGGMRPGNQPPSIAAAAVLEVAPHNAWLAALDPTVAPRVRASLATLLFKNDRETDALPQLAAIAAIQPKTALNLGHDLLRAWAQRVDPNSQRPMNPYGGYYNPYGMQPRGTPLTRSLQQRNLKELVELLAALRSLPIPTLDDKVVVAAFSAAHSAAEVFRVEDVETVFGRLDTLSGPTLAELLQTMRQRLASQWRQPRVQQQAQTKRNDKEIEAEVHRGYELVGALADRGLARHPQEWRMRLAQGAVAFDWAEFDYGRKVDLAIYTEKRDGAFRAFEAAAALYAAALPSLEEKDETPQPYVQWFNATLGASDLAYLTRQQEPSTNHLERIRQAILSLPGEAAERHLASFGKAITDSLNSLKAELKPRYTRAALRVGGTHPSLEEARRLAAYYDDLLEEIRLDVRLDGDPAVGHARPFGLFVALRHTEAVGRESGGFGRYLQNQQSTAYFYNPYGRPPVNYRDEFDKQVREKFADTLEVLSIVFHDEKTEPRGYGRPGWRETPYAYLLVKARDAAVDRIPPLQLDMDFFDRRGQVILPVSSQVVLIDARPTQPPPRPLAKPAVLQVLDDRELAQGKLQLEIKASARGILPDLSDLATLDFRGWRIAKTNDNALAITKLEVEDDAVAPLSERTWTLELTRDPAHTAPTTFQFATIKLAGCESTYKRYADADLVTVASSVALAGIPLGPRDVTRPLLLGGLTLALLIAGAIAWRRRHTASTPEQAPAFRLPQHITPFSVASLLRRIEAHPHTRLDAGQRAQLAHTIAGLERDCFARNGQPPTPTDLEKLARDWVTLAE